MTKNLTVGSPGALIIMFAIPLILGNLFQLFYNMADSFIVGREIGMEALAAIGCTTSINFLILGFMMGVTAGASIVTSQRFGAQNEAGVRRSFATSIVLTAIVTVLIMIISIATLKPLLRFLNTPANIFDDAYKYFVVILIGMPALAMFDLLSSMMRAVGDSKTPLYFLAIACIINIGLDYLFILAFDSGVAGAGVATVIAQLFAGIACIPTIKKRLPLICPTKADLKISLSEMIAHAKVALPVGFQWSIIAIGTIAVTRSLNPLGTTSVAAFATAEKINQFATMPLSSYSQAMTIYTAQNFGAKKYGRIRQGVIQGAIMSCAFSIFMFVLFVFLGKEFSALFLMHEEEAIQLSHTYLIINGALFTTLALLFTFRQSIQGLGDSLTPTISGITELVMRTFAALFLTMQFGYKGLCFASPLAWIGALVPLSISMYFKMGKLKRMELKESRKNTA
ncbi:MAG: MATE family efflux transporter [Spirochaetaceae bacterium]|jgi:putative MATE family efflux protein|nr:MATE family efflux transporter [Spirochaetaceae bacterium]